MNTTNRQELYYFYNSLAILLKAVEKKRTTVDLRNEASVFGTVDQVDGYMNIVMKNCIFTDPRGDSFNYDMFFVHARNIRFVHIPTNVRIIPAMKDQLQKLHKPVKDVTKRTFREKKVQQRQREGRAAVEKILASKGKADTSKSENK